MNCYERYQALTPAIVADMRSTLDTHLGLWNEAAQAQLREATDDEIVEYIAKNYTGGVRGYCQDAGHKDR